ncbi:hypothetical protein LX70_01346 [Defluviimonas denitrificans]|jgi:hypothetical protein|uniref:Uncharacterized protein n=1 Tax=Albidovulum denitrificans TaxID=404881 RepID=A0A2S8S9R6_9RHOB|nr:hypothetical protein [Defluviimonas denitrificans]PQV57540.1 hypothetical protein LX70_01346 [Defluviimonas denitrificans]
MFEEFDRQLKLQAIKRSLKKVAPPQFPYADSNDYYVSHLNNKADARIFLIDTITKDSLLGRLWNGECFDINADIPLKSLQLWELEITRFYGYSQTKCQGVWDFWLTELTFAPQRSWIKGRLTQSYYNARTRFRHERVDVLRKLVQLHLQHAQTQNALLTTPEPKSIIQLLSDFYGNRIYAHPQLDEVSARFRLVIESLAASGDLKKANLHEFQLEPQALETISSYEQDERRHRDSVRQNKRLFWITVIIAIATALQAYSAFFSES